VLLQVLDPQPNLKVAAFGHLYTGGRPLSATLCGLAYWGWGLAGRAANEEEEEEVIFRNTQKIKNRGQLKNHFLRLSMFFDGFLWF